MKLVLIILGLVAVLFSALMGWDGIYVGVFASESELDKYPWGTELGWSFLIKTNYMLHGLAISAISWLPFILALAMRHLTRRSN